jgi:hypothetical protein
MQLSVVRNLILMGCSDDIPVSGLLVIDTVGLRSMYFVVMPRVNLIVIFLTYHVYLYSINCPTVICLPSMCYLSYGETPLVNCGPRSYFHHIAITCLLYSHCLFYSHTLLFSTRYTHNLCFNQTGEIDNLIVSWKQSTWLCCVQVPCCYWPKTSQQVHPCWSAIKPVGITFRRLSLLSKIDIPWFLN